MTKTMLQNKLRVYCKYDPHKFNWHQNKKCSKSRVINTNDHLLYSVSVNWILQQPKQELWFNTYDLSSFSQKTRLSNPLQTFPTGITDMRCWIPELKYSLNLHKNWNLDFMFPGKAYLRMWLNPWMPMVSKLGCPQLNYLMIWYPVVSAAVPVALHMNVQCVWSGWVSILLLLVPVGLVSHLQETKWCRPPSWLVTPFQNIPQMVEGQGSWD